MSSCFKISARLPWARCCVFASFVGKHWRSVIPWRKSAVKIQVFPLAFRKQVSCFFFSSYLHSSLTREAVRLSSVLLDLVWSLHQNPISVSLDFLWYSRVGAEAELLSCASALLSSNNHHRTGVCKEGSKPLCRDEVRDDGFCCRGRGLWREMPRSVFPSSMAVWCGGGRHF